SASYLICLLYYSRSYFFFFTHTSTTAIYTLSLHDALPICLFSMQSGQFDRAIDRFKTVIEIKADAESYFYLATAYEKIGQKSEAIAAFNKSKELAADPTLSQYIDRQIESLSK